MSTKAEKKEIVVKIDERFLKERGQSLVSHAKIGRALFEERLEKDMDLYFGRFSENERKYSEYLGAMRLFIPKTYTNTQRILVDVLDSFYQDPEELVDVGSWKDTSYESRQIVKAVLNYRLNAHPINFYEELYEMGMDAIRNMIGIFKVYPMLKTEMMPKLESYTDENGMLATRDSDEMEERVVHFSPRMESVPPEDVFFSPRATWKDYYKHPMYQKYEMTVAECLSQGWKNVVNMAPAQGQETDNVKVARTEDIYSPQTRSADEIKANEVRVVYEFWDFLPDSDGEIQGGSFIMLGDSGGPVTIAREWQVNDLPYKFDEFEPNRPPFFVGMAYPEAHRMYGRSFPWNTESLQKETNAVANQEREAVARALRPMTYVNRDANVDLIALVNRRLGAHVQGDVPAGQAIQELQSMNPMAISPMHRSRINEDYYEAGIPPNLHGTSVADSTATEATQQLSNASKKISMVLKNLAFTALMPALQALLRLEQLYESDEFVKMVTGKTLGWQFADDGLPPRSFIQGDFDLKVNMAQPKQGQLNKLFLLMDRGNATNQVTSQMVQLGIVDPKQASFINVAKAFDEAMKIMGFKDINEFKIAAQPPTQGAQAPGIASQPGQVADPTAAISQTMPQAPGGALNVIG